MRVLVMILFFVNNHVISFCMSTNQCVGVFYTTMPKSLRVIGCGLCDLLC